MKRDDRGQRTKDRGRRTGSGPDAARAGQAAIEFISGLLLFLLLLAGIIHVNRMARTSLFLHAVLRGSAGERAMGSGALAVAPAHISDWEEGPDGTRYTADDEPVRNGAMLSAMIGTLTRVSVKSPGDWTYVSESRLPVSMVRLHDSPVAAATLGFIHVQEDLHVPVDPVLRQLVYGKDEVTLRETVWMPLMGGLY